MAARTIPASDELTRRIRAASAYGDFKSVDAFAAEIGLGRSTLFRIFRGKRGLREMEARQMALVAGLPPNWFDADFSQFEKLDDLVSPQPAKPAAQIPDERPRLPSQRPTRSGTRAPRSRRATS